MPNERAVKLFGDLMDLLQDFIRRHDLTYDEYRAAVMFLHEVGQSGEMPLLLDVFVESTVNEVNFKDKPGTPACIEGPYYVPDSPELTPPVELPQRADEPGEVLFFSGTVKSSAGRPLAGALLDVWHSTADGFYSNVHPNVPPGILRGRFRADDAGRFEFRSVVPSPYEIPKSGPTGRLLEEVLGRHAWRPAHVHFKVGAEGHEILTTQVYFQGDKWLGSDVAGADHNDTLAVPLERHSDPADYEKRGLSQPYASASYDFVLAPSA